MRRTAALGLSQRPSLSARAAGRPWSRPWSWKAGAAGARSSSPASCWMGCEAIWREAERVADANRRLHAALIATVVEDGALRAVALAELAHDQGDSALAETAIVVRDDYQHEGLGRMLAQFLIRLAMLRG